MGTLYDATDPMWLPAGADAYAGYDDGHWPDADAIAAKFPGKPMVRITVFPSDNFGDVLDVETGDATPIDAPGWVARRRAAGHTWPTVYCSETIWSAVRDEFTRQGVAQPCYWIASYPGPGPVVQAGAVAHQWIDHGGYDESVTIPGWPPVPHPVPPKPPAKEENDTVTVIESGGLRHVFGVVNNVAYHWWQTIAGPDFSWHGEKLPV